MRVSFRAYVLHVAACGSIGAKFGTHMQINLESDIVFFYVMG